MKWLSAMATSPRAHPSSLLFGFNLFSSEAQEIPSHLLPFPGCETDTNERFATIQLLGIGRFSHLSLTL